MIDERESMIDHRSMEKAVSWKVEAAFSVKRLQCPPYLSFATGPSGVAVL